jgi:hypothetical protein
MQALSELSLFQVQPRSKKMISNIGMGMPRSHSKMYPVAPACLILSLMCILKSRRSGYRSSALLLPGSVVVLIVG